MSGLEWLESLPNFETDRSLGFLPLSGIRSTLAALGDPEKAFRAIHVVGTNGKGSVAAMAAAVLANLGYRVGLYRSPHLCDLRERIAINMEPVPEEVLEGELAQLARMQVAGLAPVMTHFEALTAAAFAIFAGDGVEVAVIEAGMGGLRDATNVLAAEVVVVTSIGHDHLAELGPTLQDVAREKFGVVAPASAVIVGEIPPDLSFPLPSCRVLLHLGAEVRVESRREGVGGQLVAFSTPFGSYEEFVPFHGRPAAQSVALAHCAVESLLGAGLTAETAGSALAGLRLPGGFEVLGGSPVLISDSAHNREAAAALAETLTEVVAEVGAVALAVGLTGGRDPREFLGELSGLEVAVVLPLDLGVPAELVAAAALELWPRAKILEAVPTTGLRDAIAGLGRNSGPGVDAVVVTGSNRAVSALLCEEGPLPLLG